jgi:hypothetical protein
VREYSAGKAFKNVLKRQLSFSVVYPRSVMPAFLTTASDPLANLQQLERVTYLGLLFAFDFAVTQIWALIALAFFPPVPQYDIDLPNELLNGTSFIIDNPPPPAPIDDTPIDGMDLISNNVNGTGGIVFTEEDQANIAYALIGVGSFMTSMFLNKGVGRTLLSTFLVTKNSRDLRATDRCYEVCLAHGYGHCTLSWQMQASHGNQF